MEMPGTNARCPRPKLDALPTDQPLSRKSKQGSTVRYPVITAHLGVYFAVITTQPMNVASIETCNAECWRRVDGVSVYHEIRCEPLGYLPTKDSLY